MFNFIKNLLKRKPKYKMCEECTVIPFHIQELGKLYPVIHTVVNNKSTGEIKKFILDHNPCRVGQALIRKNDREVWIHLSNDYFKNIVK